MKTTFETNLYYARATQPAGNTWKSDWLTMEQAVLKAEWFVAEWLANGVPNAEACVFYRDGTLVQAFNAQIKSPAPWLA